MKADAVNKTGDRLLSKDRSSQVLVLILAMENALATSAGAVCGSAHRAHVVVVIRIVVTTDSFNRHTVPSPHVPVQPTQAIEKDLN